MGYTDNNRDFWDEHFKNTSFDYPNESVVRFLARCRKWYPQGKVLDWGCATGRHVMVALKFGFDVMAADYVENCVDITRHKVENELTTMPGKVIDYIVNKDVDIEGVEDNSLDAILAFGVVFLDSMDKMESMLDNIYRMLKPGGRAFCDFRTEDDSVCKNNDRVSEYSYVITDENHFQKGFCLTVLPLEKLKSILEEKGFVIDNIEIYEFTDSNMANKNSWWHVTLLKPEQ